MATMLKFRVPSAFYKLVIFAFFMILLIKTNLEFKITQNNDWELELTIFGVLSETEQNGGFEVKGFLDTLQGDWQKVEHPPDYSLYVYSAYSYDENTVIIITGQIINPKKINIETQCQFSSKNVRVQNTTTICKQENQIFQKCPLPKGVKEKFEFVSILLGNQTSSSVRLPIIYRNIKSDHREFKMSACVLPLYWYDEVLHFIEWFEFYMMMGVEHFTFYNISIGPSTSCVMKNIMSRYSGEITVKINPWHKYPQKRDNDIRYQVGLGQAINECVYTHKGVSKYMVFADVDEFIVPEISHIKNYHQLIDHLLVENKKNESSKKKIAEFRFRHAFYLKSRDPDGNLLERCSPFRSNFQEFHVCTQLFTMIFDKRDNFRPWHSRTKFIVIPEGISWAHNHYTYSFEKGYGTLLVPENIAFMRHYRYFNKPDNITTSQQMPESIAGELVTRVSESLEYFRDACNLTDTQMFKTSLKF